MLRGIALAGGALLAPLCFRALWLLESDAALERADLRGLLADLVVALALICAIGVLPRSRPGRAVAAVAGVLWGVVHYANAEHLRALGAPVDATYAGFLLDPVFVRGSALAVQRPWLLAAVAMLGALGLGFGAGALRGRLVLAPAALLALSLAALVAWPVGLETAPWRQSHFALLSLRPRAALVERLPPAEADLGGSPRIPLPGRARNVLVVVIEGLSALYLPSFVATAALHTELELARLDALSRRGLAFVSLLTHQRQSNRGMYALLCGRAPGPFTREPEVSELVGKGPLPCLPRALAQAGYRTVYVQSAPLPFMFFDQFMAQAGFERAHGAELFERAYARNLWGVDDRALFERVIPLLGELEAGGAPWFVTVMTASTHHPYAVPAEFRGEHEPGTPPWAYEYTDRALGELHAGLERAGLLDDTLVLLVSDESSGPLWASSPLAVAVGQAWGVLIALAPDLPGEQVRDRFAQSDLALSVLDYLGLSAAAGGFSGRSLFRRYASPRAIGFGNTYLGIVGGYSADGIFAFCDEALERCVSAPVAADTVVPDGGRLARVPSSEVPFVRDLAARSRTPLPGERHLALVSGERVSLPPGETLVLAGQFLDLRARERLQVELDVELEGPAGEARLRHDVSARRRKLLEPLDQPGVRAGQRWRLRYRIDPAEPNDRVEIRLWADSKVPGLALRFHRASADVFPDAGDGSGRVRWLERALE